jgi:hypothetical protein
VLKEHFESVPKALEEESECQEGTRSHLKEKRVETLRNLSKFKDQEEYYHCA